MTIQKMSDVLVDYSLALRPGETFLIRATTLAEPLAMAVYEKAIKVGAHPYFDIAFPEAEETLLRHGNAEQLERESPLLRLAMETFDATLRIEAPHNTRALTGIEPARLAAQRRGRAGPTQTLMARTARGEARWALTLFPTQAGAQEADMSLHEYGAFVYGACMLDAPDPVAAWRALGAEQQRYVDWLAGRKHVEMKGTNIDLSLSIDGRRFANSDGKRNFPSGEIFTGPVEDSVNGWVRFGYPAIFAGQEVTGVELWFEDGRVVKERAEKGQAALTSLLNTDAGARTLGEWGIGTNAHIRRFTRNMLFDEKIGGTIHLAVGSSYAETGGRNQSALHWDMLCDMAESEIVVDGEVAYRNGKFVI